MNQERNMTKELDTPQTGVAGAHIRLEISKQPKMSAGVAAHVARNLDTLLEELKDQGVSMHSICRAAKLGNPDDRDSKALFKYRNPPGSAPRDYISQATKYVRIAEAITDIKDHPYSGTSSQILRRVFAGTPYSPASTKSADASIALKGILDEITSWIARQINLVEAYERLQSLDSRGGKPTPSWQFKVGSQGEWHKCNLDLGHLDTPVFDAKGQPLVVKCEKGRLHDLRLREDISLFIGIDNDNVPRPYLAFETSAVIIRPGALEFDAAGEERFNIFYVEDGSHEATEFGDLVFDSYGKHFWLPKKDVERTVDLEIIHKRWLDDDDSPKRSQNPVRDAFLRANREVESHFELTEVVREERKIKAIPVSADSLELVEVTLGKPGAVFSPLNERMKAVNHLRGSGKHLAFGEGILAQLIAWFTGTHLFYQLDSVETEFLGDDILNSPMAPAGGWINVDPTIRNKDKLLDYLSRYELPVPVMLRYDEPGTLSFVNPDFLNFDDVFVCSAADVLWLRYKMFVMEVEDQFVALTKEQRADYDALLQRLRGDEVSQFER